MLTQAGDCTRWLGPGRGGSSVRWVPSSLGIQVWRGLQGPRPVPPLHLYSRHGAACVGGQGGPCTFWTFLCYVALFPQGNVGPPPPSCPAHLPSTQEPAPGPGALAKHSLVPFAAHLSVLCPLALPPPGHQRLYTGLTPRGPRRPQRPGLWQCQCLVLAQVRVEGGGDKSVALRTACSYASLLQCWHFKHSPQGRG